jgi:hypothetical protein
MAALHCFRVPDSLKAGFFRAIALLTNDVIVTATERQTKRKDSETCQEILLVDHYFPQSLVSVLGWVLCVDRPVRLPLPK